MNLLHWKWTEHFCITVSNIVILHTGIFIFIIWRDEGVAVQGRVTSLPGWLSSHHLFHSGSKQPFTISSRFISWFFMSSYNQLAMKISSSIMYWYLLKLCFWYCWIYLSKSNNWWKLEPFRGCSLLSVGWEAVDGMCLFVAVCLCCCQRSFWCPSIVGKMLIWAFPSLSSSSLPCLKFQSDSIYFSVFWVIFSGRLYQTLNTYVSAFGISSEYLYELE